VTSVALGRYQRAEQLAVTNGLSDCDDVLETIVGREAGEPAEKRGSSGL